jgi:hypothetical protein
MDQSLLLNQRAAYRLITDVSFACVRASGADNDSIWSHLRRSKKQLVRVNISMQGISFPATWEYNNGDLLAICFKSADGDAISSLAKIVRIGLTDDAVTVSAQFIHMSGRNGRRLASLLLDCHHEECVSKRTIVHQDCRSR